MFRWFNAGRVSSFWAINCLGAAAVVITVVCCVPCDARVHAATGAEQALLPISIDYPETGSNFPPGITPPTFLWRDAEGTSWAIDIAFADGSQPLHVVTGGERMKLGRISPRSISKRISRTMETDREWNYSWI